MRYWLWLLLLVALPLAARAEVRYCPANPYNILECAAGSTTTGGGGGGGSGTVGNVGTLTNNRIIIGAGGTDVTVAPSITGLVLGNGGSAPSAYAGTACTNQFMRSLSAAGAATCNSVSLVTDVTGTLQAAQHPALTGDVTSAAGSLATTIAPGAVTNSKVTDVAATKLTGTLQAGQFPALTGNVTTTAGSLATTIAAGAVTNAMLAGSIDLATKVTGALPAVNGGTGLTSAPDDAVITGTGTIWQARLLPNCTDTAGQHLNYDTSSNTWICGTSTSGITAVTALGSLPADELIAGNGGTQIKTATMPLLFKAEDTSTQFSITATQGAVDYLEVQAGLAGIGATLAAASVIDSNVDMGLVAQGAGCVNLGNGEFLTPIIQACGSAVNMVLTPVNITGKLTVTGSLVGAGSTTVTAQPATGNYSNVRYETLTITGAGSLGTPTSGFLNLPELTPHTLTINSAAGHTNNTTTGDGQTLLLGYVTNVTHTGPGGYAGGYYGATTVAGTLPGSTHFIAGPAGGVFSGHTFAGANAVFLNPIEIHNADNGFDAAAIGIVLDFTRTNNTGAKGAIWTGIRIQSSGSAAMDNAYTMAGNFLAGLDLTPGTYTTHAAAITMKTNDRMYFDATATPDASGFVGHTTNVGQSFIGSDGTALQHYNNPSVAAASLSSVKATYVGSHASGTTGHGAGVLAIASNNSTGAHSFLEGIRTTVSNTGGGTATYAAGIYIASPTGTNITNALGFFVEDINVSGANNYAILLQQSTGYALIHTGAAPSYHIPAFGVGESPYAQASAALVVGSTTQGFLPPRMTTTQRDAISSPAEGLMVYNTTTHRLNVRDNSAWKVVTFD